MSEGTMHPATLKALRGSIEKWEGIVAGTAKNDGYHNCPLCHLFHPKYEGGFNCGPCPVAQKAGADFCERTPYARYEKIESDLRGLSPEDEEHALEIEHLTTALKAVAQAELDFLKSLLPA